MQSAEIKGLDVFSIVDGNNIGKVRDLIINAGSKAVDYLLVDISNWYAGSYVIPFAMAVGIGRDAVMVETENSIININDDPLAVKLVESGIKLIGTRVLTRKGRVIGKISEFDVDPETGKVLGCELADNDNNIQGIIPAETAITFGRDALVVEDDVNDHLQRGFDQPTPSGKDASAAEMKEGTAVISESGATAIPEPGEGSSSASHSKAVDLFEQKQQEYLLGRQVKRDITDHEGNIIAKKDSVINREIIDKAMQAGKFKELMMNV